LFARASEENSRRSREFGIPVALQTTSKDLRRFALSEGTALRVAEKVWSRIAPLVRQRVAIARSVAYDPDVLLMDEPFAALDAQTREILQGELLRIWEESGKTIVFITHGIDEAVYLGQRIAVMTSRPGRIKQVIDTPLESRSREEDLRATPESSQLRHHLELAA
jgi:ABC-type nitrate/sulfonate/bicarbonate transport system ATPase subunit